MMNGGNDMKVWIFFILIVVIPNLVLELRFAVRPLQREGRQLLQDSAQLLNETTDKKPKQWPQS